jgi:hypothetical protein
MRFVLILSALATSCIAIPAGGAFSSEYLDNLAEQVADGSFTLGTPLILHNRSA